jgi:hypothetical protein
MIPRSAGSAQLAGTPISEALLECAEKLRLERANATRL